MPKIFLLYLVIPGRWGGLYSALSIFTVLLLAYWSTGIFSISDAPVGVVLFFISIPAYISPMLAWVASRADACFESLSKLLPDEHNRPTSLQQLDFTRRGWDWQLISVFFGLLGATLHSAVMFQTDSLDFSDASPATSVVLVGTYMTWIVISVFVAALVDIALTFRRAASVIEVDLLHIDDLTPFAAIAIGLALTMIGAQSINSFMFFGGYTLVALLPGWLGLFAPLLALMIIPVWPVHQAILKAKSEELSRINQSISDVQRRDTTPDQFVNELNPLLSYRREITETREWPFDLGFYSRLFFYLLIPPFTWVGAALIEQVVDSFL